MSNNTLANKLPYWHFHHDYMVFMDGSFGLGFKIDGADISSASNETINNLSKKFETLLVSLDEGMKIQLVYDVKANIESILNAHKSASTESVEIYKPISKARFDQFEEIANNGGFYNPDLYIFVRSQHKQLLKKKFWQKQEHFEQITQESFQAALFYFERQIKTIESSLRQMNFNPSRLSSEQWFKLVFEYFNSDRSERIGVPNLREFSVCFR